jgi:two-component system chemotaxis response regulator CheY
MKSKILVVDDEPDFCGTLVDFLEAKGYSVLEAHDGDQALAVYRQERPDLVLMDIRMPGKDGIETLRELRAFDPEARVIMVTAVDEEGLAARTITQDGAYSYITKPVNSDYLEALIKQSTLS